ncbi:MAG: DMT family transporter [Pedobacter sp.]|nr:MAG: DMT family transporter [Pedobacter sp.]
MNNNILKGSLLVGLGASSYGMLATFVKMAYTEGFTTAEVTLSQFSLGVLGLLFLNLLRKNTANSNPQPLSKKSVLKLMTAGISMGLTSIFYYMSVQYLPVSVGIVLLMQTVWMGVILEMILHRKAPGGRKIISVFIILIGTLLATNIFKESIIINWVGIGWGLLAALSYTASVYASNSVELQLPPLKRSLFLILGGLITIACIFHASIGIDFSYDIFLRWGLFLALFGTILPPLLFTKGMPLTGMGLGAIIAAVEIPVSVLMAHFVLDEEVNLAQWTGILLILFSVVLMNLKLGERGETSTL